MKYSILFDIRWLLRLVILFVMHVNECDWETRTERWDLTQSMFWHIYFGASTTKVSTVIIFIIIIIIIIKAICNAQDPLKKAANALFGSLKMLVSIYNVSYKQQCLQLCPKGRETIQSDIRNAVGKMFHTEGPETAKLLSP